MGNDSGYYRLAMRVFADFSGTIALPAVLAALLGKWLDTTYGTEPRYMALCLLVAFGLTALLVVKKAKRYGREYADLMKKETEMKKEKHL